VSVYPVGTDSDTIVRLLRRLPPRERLRVMIQILPELERDLPASPPASDFWQGVELRTLIQQQGVQPIPDFDTLLGGWPEDEPVDDFVVAIRGWRRQNLAQVCAQ
jgi:hypothetical protein